MDTKLMTKKIYDALDDKKGINITIIDITEISTVADYFVIAGGSNENQVKAMADAVEEVLIKEEHVHPNHIEGYQNANWILLDYTDVIVHVFNQDDRLFYDLERIWRDGKIIDVDQLA